MKALFMVLCVIVTRDNGLLAVSEVEEAATGEDVHSPAGFLIKYMIMTVRLTTKIIPLH